MRNSSKQIHFLTTFEHSQNALNFKKVCENSWNYSYLSQHHYHLNPWSVLVTKDMVHEGGAWISGQRGTQNADLNSYLQISDNN